MKFHTSDRITCLSALLVIGVLCPNVSTAGWGSIHGNNRSAPPAHAATPRPGPAPRPAPAPRPEPAPRPGPLPHPEPAPRPEDHGRPAPVDVNRARVDQANRQRLDVGEERRQSAYWSDYHAGMRIDRLPEGYRSFAVRGHPYFFFQGVFYDNGPSGYIVVAPPVDAVITDLPPDTETVVVGDTYYYYAGGAFYVQQSDGTYIVVAPPMGVEVSTLPPDATATVIVNGITCYQGDGACYEPVMANGATVYLTIPLP